MDSTKATGESPATERANKDTCRRVHDGTVEKRGSARYPFSANVEAIDAEASIRMIGRLSDISRDGCYIDTISPFAINAAVALTITKDGQSFHTQANVVYSMTGMGMGLAFATSTPDQLLVLEAWLEELSGGTPAKHKTSSTALQSGTTTNTDGDLRDVLRELIALLNGKNVVSDSEGMAMLRKLSK
jgi:PilZ domain